MLQPAGDGPALLPGDAPPLPDGASLQPPDATAAACPPTYLRIGGSAYRFSLEFAAWLDAERACEADGPTSHLAVVSSDAEQGVLEDAGGLDDVWVGLSNRRQFLTWRWVTGDVESVAGTYQTGGRCASYSNLVGLAPYQDCADEKLYACECDGEAASADHY